MHTYHKLYNFNQVHRSALLDASLPTTVQCDNEPSPECFHLSKLEL